MRAMVRCMGRAAAISRALTSRGQRAAVQAQERQSKARGEQRQSRVCSRSRRLPRNTRPRSSTAGHPLLTTRTLPLQWLSAPPLAARAAGDAARNWGITREAPLPMPTTPTRLARQACLLAGCSTLRPRTPWCTCATAHSSTVAPSLVDLLDQRPDVPHRLSNTVPYYKPQPPLIPAPRRIIRSRDRLPRPMFTRPFFSISRGVELIT